jgi:hypothetical protein
MLDQKLWNEVLNLLEELDRSQHTDRGVGKYEENEIITRFREALKTWSEAEVDHQRSQ